MDILRRGWLSGAVGAIIHHDLLTNVGFRRLVVAFAQDRAGGQKPARHVDR